jgi:hypothetical protein
VPNVKIGDDSGPLSDVVPVDDNLATRIPADTLALPFADGNAANYAYTVMLPGTAPAPQTRQITRLVFRAPATVCY